LASPVCEAPLSEQLTQLPSSRMYKIGGSLLDWPALPERLRALNFFEPSSPPPLLVVGGGPAADVVREWDRVHLLGEETAHFLALESLSLTARLLCSLLPETVLVQNLSELHECWAEQRIPVLDVPRWTEQLEPASTLKLPHHWQTTSDSIALWLACQFQAESLTLIKSVPPPADCSLFSAIQSDLIDQQFTQLLTAGHFPEIFQLHWIDLRTVDLSCSSTISLYRGEIR